LDERVVAPTRLNIGLASLDSTWIQINLAQPGSKLTRLDPSSDKLDSWVQVDLA